jgi:hypothetical protein
MKMPYQAGALQRPRVVPGIVVSGHGVASGTASDTPYPAGSIPLQLPHFRSLGLDLTALHPATLNVSIGPRRFQLTNPRHTFRQLRWIEGSPPEDFSFSPCRVRFAAETYDGFVYHPHPETKERHHQDPSTLEIITACIPEIRYGDRVELELEADEIAVFEA